MERALFKPGPGVTPAQPDDPRWSDLWIRTASALVLGPLTLFCVWQGGWAWDFLLLAAMAGLGREWGRLMRLERPYLFASLMGLVWFCAFAAGVQTGLAGMASIWLAARLRLGSFAAYGVPYIGLGGLALLWLRQQPAGLADAIFLITVVWGTDIGAYLTGRLVGGPKLAPKISPGKTWAGSAGGMLLAAIAAALFAGAGKSAPLGAFACGALLSFCAQGGDLLESAIKRRLGVKDSGQTIPGHGGLFDRLDGFLAAAPMAALLALCGQGGMPLWQ